MAVSPAPLLRIIVPTALSTFILDMRASFYLIENDSTPYYSNTEHFADLFIEAPSSVAVFFINSK